MAVELIDELEAGELSVEFEGEEPQTVLEWALERFSPSIAISTAFQIDGVALIDMAYELDPEVKVFSVDTGRDLRPDRTPARPLSRACARPALARRGRGVAHGWEARPEPLPEAGRPS